MTQQIPLQPIPSQSLSVSLDNVQWDIELQACQGGVMAISLTRDGVLITSGVRCISGAAILQGAKLEAGGGNFAFATPNGDLPWYERFADDHLLIYASAQELAEARA